MRGFMITASVEGEELASPRFHPFWAAAEELGTVIFIHPRNFPAAQSRLGGNGRLDNVIGNPLETTVALSHLIFEGTLDRHPGVKICAAHGGGYLPSYIGRSDHCAEHAQQFCAPVGKLPSEYLNQLYFDSLIYTTENLRHLINTVGAGPGCHWHGFSIRNGRSRCGRPRTECAGPFCRRAGSDFGRYSSQAAWNSVTENLWLLNLI